MRTFSYIIVLNKNIGTIADENGVFQLDISKIKDDDTICISNIGYISKYLNRHEFLSKSRYHLMPYSYLLNEVEVIAKKNIKYKELELGNKTNKVRGFFCFRPGDQIGLLINNISGNENMMVKNAYFYITSKGVPDTKFRIRIYSQVNNFPGIDILTDNIVANAIQGDEWVNVYSEQTDPSFLKLTPLLEGH